MHRSSVPQLLAFGAAALLVTGCLDKDPRGATGPITREVQGLDQIDLSYKAPFATPPDELLKDTFFTQLGWTPEMLPKWKTNWERNLERLALNAKAQGLPYADAYSDYRDLNYTKFFITKAPVTKGFRTPAEYEVSQAYLLNWRSGSTYTTGNWKTLFQDIIKGGWGVVPVILITSSSSHETSLKSELAAMGYSAADIAKNVIFWEQKTDAIWARDFGPVSIVEGGSAGTEKLSFIDYRYYYQRMYDDEVPHELATDWGINVFRPDLDFEGGNFQTTTDMLCSATKGVLWYNLNLSQSAVEQIFKDYQGCKSVLMPAPMTGGVIAHIDMWSKFGDDDKMMVGEYTATQSSANKTILDANAALFAATKTPSGKTITVTRIPMPDIGSSGGTKIWRTYTNSLALNGGAKKTVLIPTYSDETKNEAAAMVAYGKVFPGYTLVKIDSKVIIPGQGAIHCITMQIPTGVKGKMETAPAALCGATKWQCTPTGCGNITSQGCCDGTLLKYCNGSKLGSEDCSSNPSCGWSSSSKWYDCGTSGGSDPAGTYVKNCGVLTDAAVPDGKMPDAGACGSVTSTGCCNGEVLTYCEKGVVKTLNCTAIGSPKCGWNSSAKWYDCGTSGGSDPNGGYPKACTGTGDGGPKPGDAKATDAKTDGGSTTCGKITSSGCCDGETLKYCLSNKLYTSSCSGKPKCGWNATSNWYDCGTAGTADPSGKLPMACPSTTDAGADKGKPDITAPDKGKPDVTVPDTGAKDTKPAGEGLKSDSTPSTNGGQDDDGCALAGTSAGTPSLPLVLFGLGLAALTRKRRTRS